MSSYNYHNIIFRMCGMEKTICDFQIFVDCITNFTILQILF